MMKATIITLEVDNENFARVLLF